MREGSPDSWGSDLICLEPRLGKKRALPATLISVLSDDDSPQPAKRVKTKLLYKAPSTTTNAAVPQLPHPHTPATSTPVPLTADALQAVEQRMAAASQAHVDRVSSARKKPRTKVPHAAAADPKPRSTAVASAMGDIEIVTPGSATASTSSTATAPRQPSVVTINDDDFSEAVVIKTHTHTHTVRTSETTHTKTEVVAYTPAQAKAVPTPTTTTATATPGAAPQAIELGADDQAEHSAAVSADASSVVDSILAFFGSAVPRARALEAIFHAGADVNRAVNYLLENGLESAAGCVCVGVGG